MGHPVVPRRPRRDLCGGSGTVAPTVSMGCETGVRFLVKRYSQPFLLTRVRSRSET